MTTYSFQDVASTIVGPGGAFSLGYGEATAEEGITIARAGDKNTMTIGSDGEGMHSLHADKSGQITLRYLKTAPINAKLMALYDAQSLDSRLWGKNLIEVRQTAAGDVLTARSCAFKKAPDLKYAKDGDIVEWVFDSIKIDNILGTY
ncbi:phage structural protein [Burkholderia cenocepacia]|uniref:phage structural protein n=1 Tax=Burkholderia cenocepacia TaxID=95486 RepID=UPI002ABDF99B|nr:phage protein [Burkholderia cenocepacia]